MKNGSANLIIQNIAPVKTNTKANQKFHVFSLGSVEIQVDAFLKTSFAAIFINKKPRWHVASEVVKLKQDYFLRRNISSEAPPSAAKASDAGSGTGGVRTSEPFAKVVGNIDGSPVPDVAKGVIVPTLVNPK